MSRERTCEYCSKNFIVKRKQQVGRFCSSLCNRKVLRANQLKEHSEYISNETEEQKLQWLRDHYEKFAIKNTDDCWDWGGHKKCDGYAVFNHRGKLMTAHRTSWIIHNGEIPKGIFVLHKCDVRHCSNPQHLFLGTHTDNMRDMAKKVRTKVRAKLTESQVREIKNLLSLGVSMVRIGEKYNISDVAVYNIKAGITWKHIV